MLLRRMHRTRVGSPSGRQHLRIVRLQSGAILKVFCQRASRFGHLWNQRSTGWEPSMHSWHVGLVSGINKCIHRVRVATSSQQPRQPSPGRNPCNRQGRHPTDSVAKTGQTLDVVLPGTSTLTLSLTFKWITIDLCRNKYPFPLFNRSEGKINN